MAQSKSVNQEDRKLNLKHLISQNTDEFCQNTTLHGLKYMSSKQLYPSERWFFSFSVLIVLLGSAYFVFAIYDKWENTPVIVGLSPNPALIMREAFPAVTICNSNFALRSKAMELQSPSAEQNMLHYLCKEDANYSTSSVKTNWSSYEHFIIDISQPCERMLLSCQFASIEFNCSEFFYPVLTDEGFCCVFNMLHSDFMYVSRVPTWLRSVTQRSEGYEPVDWNAESGYSRKLPPKYYPRRVVGPGVSLGVNFVLDVQSHEYYCGSSNSIGFKILVHPSNESPSMREAGILIEPGKETKMRVRTEKIETEMKLRGMRARYRRCLFRGEAKLRYYAHYTQRNCERECDADLQILYCGCRSYHMPSVSDNTPICNSKNEECIKAVRFRTYPNIKSCIDACMPSCFDIGFTSDVFAVRLDEKAFNDANPTLSAYNGSYLRENIAVVNTYFKDYSLRSQLKTEFIGTSDFLASVGGLIGLFIGFSFISLAELMYFAVLRPGRAIILYHFGKRGARPRQSMSNAGSLGTLRLTQTPGYKRFKPKFPHNNNKVFYEPHTVKDVNLVSHNPRLLGAALLQSLQDDKVHFIN